ncbi:c-type cytochrome [Aliiroseovarius sp.]|uniref:c-type cytochrome n=1 Tax=Aliiroseovarius sp. TaxID=1872442 RepID=UPI003BA98390
MNRALFTGAGIAGVVLVGATFWPRQDGTTDLPDAETLALGAALYAETCASCHGTELEGQPNWRQPGPDGILSAPPHDATGHTWHHGDDLLFAYTKYGGAETLAARGVNGFASGIPGFGDQLTDGQISAVLSFIKSTWPEDIRSQQAERTRMERAGS